MRRALRLLALSAVVLSLYCVARTVNIVSPLFNVSIGDWQLAASVFSAIGIVILSVSLTMPSWGAHLSRTHKWMRDYSSYRALYPLWRSLYESSPDVALESPSASITDMNYRLHRRVIEIRDAWRTLRPYMSDPAAGAPAVAVPAGGEEGGEAEQAAVEALKIKSALRAKESGHPVNGHHLNGSGEHGAETFSAEISWLTLVSEAYARLD